MAHPGRSQPPEEEAIGERIDFEARNRDTETNVQQRIQPHPFPASYRAYLRHHVAGKVSSSASHQVLCSLRPCGKTFCGGGASIGDTADYHRRRHTPRRRGSCTERRRTGTKTEQAVRHIRLRLNTALLQRRASWRPPKDGTFLWTARVTTCFTFPSPRP